MFSVKEWCDLENMVRFRSSSLEMAPFDRSHRNSYSPSIWRYLVSSGRYSDLLVKIAKFLYPTCIYHPRRRNTVIISWRYGADKTRMIGLPYGEKLWQYVKPFSSDTGTSRADRHRRTDTQCQTDRFAISNNISIARQAQFSMTVNRKGPFIAT